MSSLESRNLVIEEQFGPELVGARVGWSAITRYGSAQPDQMAEVNLFTATIGEEGARLVYESREEDGEPWRAYWNNAAEGFIASTALSVIVDTTKAPDQQTRGVGPYWSSSDSIIGKSSDGRLLRQGASSHRNEDELREAKVWANDPAELMANVKQAMETAGLMKYYPSVYYTANIMMIHDQLGGEAARRKVPVESLGLPDASMAETTAAEQGVAEEIVENLEAEVEQNETMLKSLTAFGAILAEEIPDAFQASREEVAAAEQRVIAAEKRLHTQHGVFLPVGYPFGGRTWPFMDASLSVSDQSSFGMELAKLREGDTGLAEREIKREVDELGRRLQFARNGVSALRLLHRAEVELDSRAAQD